MTTKQVLNELAASEAVREAADDAAREAAWIQRSVSDSQHIAVRSLTAAEASLEGADG